VRAYPRRALAAIDSDLPGELRVISMCAGDGRDPAASVVHARASTTAAELGLDAVEVHATSRSDP